MMKEKKTPVESKRIIYVSSTVSAGFFLELFPDLSKSSGQQIQKFHRLVMKGLVENGAKVISISSLPITKGKTSRLFIFRKPIIDNKIKYIHIPTIIFTPFKLVFNFLFSLIYVFIQSIFRPNTRIMCDPLNISISFGAMVAAKVLSLNITGIVTDLPEHLFDLNKKSLKTCNFILKNMDSYVFLTESMNERVNILNKPSLIMEGLVDDQMANIENALSGKHEKPTIMYAGLLNEKYGIKNLLSGFNQLEIPNVELHIYGDGNCREDVIQATFDNPNVKYFGVVDNSKIVEEELKATLLINPRPTNEEFVKYSFPSKNLEYMVSGTPLITTLLPGIPKEYFLYTFNIVDYSANGIADVLRSTLSLSKTQLHEKGESAKNFVISKKNNVVQGHRVLSFLFSIK